MIAARTRSRLAGSSLLLLMPFSLFLGCEEGDSGTALSVRDSLGVRIVTNDRAGDAPSPFSLSPEPLLRIGWDGTHEFGGIRTGAILQDGSFVVGDQVLGELVLISPDGSELSRIGRKGEGPGEFRGIYRVIAAGRDTIVVQEPYGGLVLFSRHDLLREFPGGASRTLSALGIDLEGRVVFGPPRAIEPFPDGAPDRWESLPITGLRLSTGELEELVRVEYAERTSGNIFFPQTVAAISGGNLAVARRDIPEIRWIDSSGELFQISRWQEEGASPTDSLWSEIAEGYHARWDSREGADGVEESLDEARASSSGPVPLFIDMVGDGDGGVWIGDYVSYWGDPPRQYRIITPDGVLTGRIEMPPRFRVLAIRGNLVLGVETDELDVPAVAVYRLSQ